VNFKQRQLINYVAVGVLCSGVYAFVLIIMGRLFPLWIANPLAFLFASLAGSLGHSRLSFKDQTRGDNFAKRWVAAQYFVNLSVCIILPFLMPYSFSREVELFILIFTPTLLNFIVWSKAARFSAQRFIVKSKPIIHADDLGLCESANEAIIALASKGALDSASLLVNAPATDSALDKVKNLRDSLHHFEIHFHLCLTEGPSAAPCAQVPLLVNKAGMLKYSFSMLFLLSMIPPFVPFRRKIENQVGAEIREQINKFKRLTCAQKIKLDGHQHIHLVPMVMHCLTKDQTISQNIEWIRTTVEPIPTGLSFDQWLFAIKSLGIVKWLLLQVLSFYAMPMIKNAKIYTNDRFSGVLFTGQMTMTTLTAGIKELSTRRTHPMRTPSMVLSHPYLAFDSENVNLRDRGFIISHDFASSPNRMREYEALLELGV
jgi:chitin disaccharide deacetylase